MDKNKEYYVQEAIRLYGNSHDGTIDSITSSAQFTSDLWMFSVAAIITLLFAVLIFIPSPKNFQITYQGRLGALFIVFAMNTISQLFLTRAFGMYLYVNWTTVWQSLDTINQYTSMRLFW